MKYLNKRDFFEKNGYIIFKNIIDDANIDNLKEISDQILNYQNKEHFKDNYTTGSMVMIDWVLVEKYKVLGDLIVNHKVINKLYELGFNQPKFGHGRIISKPPKSPRLFWHEDGRFWNDPLSYTNQPIQCFIMYYLTDTSRNNGCLRVIPGSHRKRHELHDQALERHNDDLRTYVNPKDIQFQDAEGEIDVCLNAGDAVMGYANMFHASHANKSDNKRTVLTLWYYPDYVNLPERTQATIYSLENQKIWPFINNPNEHIYNKYRIEYKGNAKIIEQEWKPGKDLT